MSKKERYRTDSDYRQRILARVKEKHVENLASPIYRKLIATRKAIWQAKESVGNYQRKTKALKRRLKALEYRKEELELAFGKERAERKKGYSDFNVGGE